MEFCSKMNKRLILFSFVFLLVMGSFVIAEEVQQEITLIKTQQNMQQAIDENARTVTYTFSSSDSAIEVQRKSYWSVIPDSENNKAYIKTDDKGSLIEADLTASKETSWTFGQETLKVPEGARVVFKDGKIEVFGKENQQVGLTDKTSGTELKSSLTLGKEPVSIENGIISGKNFQIGDIKVQSGSLSLSNGGYVLGKNSLADWKGLTLGNGKDLFLATSEIAYNSYSGSAIFPEDLRLRGKGEGFDVLFNEGNSFAHVDSRDNFEIKAEKGFEFSLENIEKDKPRLTLSGEGELKNGVNQIKIENNKVFRNRNSLLENFGSTDLEVFLLGEKNKFSFDEQNKIKISDLKEEESLIYIKDPNAEAERFWNSNPDSLSNQDMLKIDLLLQNPFLSAENKEYMKDLSSVLHINVAVNLLGGMAMDLKSLNSRSGKLSQMSEEYFKQIQLEMQRDSNKLEEVAKGSREVTIAIQGITEQIDNLNTENVGEFEDNLRNLRLLIQEQTSSLKGFTE